MTISSDEQRALLVWVSAGHRDELLEHHVAKRILTLLEDFGPNNLPDLDKILFEVGLVLGHINRDKVSFCCAAIFLSANYLHCWIVGNRFVLYRHGEWLVAEPRDVENPYLRGFEGAAINAGCPLSALISHIQIPIASAKGVSITDAANFRRKSIEPILHKIAIDQISESAMLKATLANAIQDQVSGTITVAS